MRSIRGLIASLGAGISVAVAVALSLGAVSALVAFSGWPEVRRTAAAPAVALPAGDRLAAASARPPARPALGGAPARPGDVAGAAAGRRHARRARRTRTGRPGRSGSSGSGSVAGRWPEGGGTLTTPSSTGAARPVHAPGGDRNGGVGSGGGTLQRVTDGVGTDGGQTHDHVVPPETPKPADAVQQAGAAVGGAVQQAGAAAGGALQQTGTVVGAVPGPAGAVLKPAADALQQAGTTLSGTLDQSGTAVGVLLGTGH